MTASPKDLYLTMMEIIRKCSEPGAANLHEKDNFQRGRSNKTNHLDWAVMAKKYLDNLPSMYQLSMQAIYWNNTPKPMDRVIYFADEGLDKWYSSLPAALISQGERVVAQVI